MLIVGVDPGTDHTGICLYEKDSSNPIIDHFCIEYSLDKSLHLQVYISTQRLIKECPKKPDLVIFESFVGRGNTREVIGNMKLVLDEHKIAFTEVTPGHSKKNMTGKGNASKAEVIKAVNAKFGLNLTYKTRHEADAIAIAHCCEVMNEKG